MKIIKSDIMKSSFIKINLVMIAILVIILFCFVTTEQKDQNTINSLYEKLRKKEIDLTSYLQSLNAYPIWRISSFIGIGITIILSFYLYLLLNSGIDNNNKHKLMFLFFWFCFFIVTINVLMAFNFLNWHYVSNDGGLLKTFTE